jgi:hypothetical protein
MSIEKTMKGRVINKHRTEQEWYSSVYKADGSFVDSPFIPLDGELIIYDPDDVNKERRFKFGDGKRYVTDLPFAVNTASGSGDNSLQFAGATEATGEGSIAMGDQSSSVTDYSVAIGKEVTAGCKAYYFSAIDLDNKNIYLSETKEELPVSNMDLVKSSILTDSSIIIANGIIFDRDQHWGSAGEPDYEYFAMSSNGD